MKTIAHSNIAKRFGALIALSVIGAVLAGSITPAAARNHGGGGGGGVKVTATPKVRDHREKPEVRDHRAKDVAGMKGKCIGRVCF